MSDTNLSNEIDLTNAVVTEVENEVRTTGAMFDAPPPNLDGPLQAYATSHASGDQAKLARGIAERLCDEGYHAESVAWSNMADSLEAIQGQDEILAALFGGGGNDGPTA